MKVVFVTGAGISAEAGIPTFETLYDETVHNDQLDYEAQVEELNNKIAGLIEFIRDTKLEPTAIHKVIAELETIADVVVYTQNIDDLHEQAGSKHVFHIHGTPTNPVLWGHLARYIDKMERDIKAANSVIVIGTRCLYPYIIQPLKEKAFFKPGSVTVFDPRELHELDDFAIHPRSTNYPEYLRAMFLLET